MGLFVFITIDDFCAFVSNATRKGFWVCEILFIPILYQCSSQVPKFQDSICVFQTFGPSKITIFDYFSFKNILKTPSKSGKSREDIYNSQTTLKITKKVIYSFHFFVFKNKVLSNYFVKKI